MRCFSRSAACRCIHSACSDSPSSYAAAIRMGESFHRAINPSMVCEAVSSEPEGIRSVLRAPAGVLRARPAWACYVAWGPDEAPGFDLGPALLGYTQAGLVHTKPGAQASGAFVYLCKAKAHVRQNLSPSTLLPQSTHSRVLPASQSEPLMRMMA